MAQQKSSKEFRVNRYQDAEMDTCIDKAQQNQKQNHGKLQLFIISNSKIINSNSGKTIKIVETSRKIQVK